MGGRTASGTPEAQLMSGHSKWSSIKHKKAARDARRGKVFTKLIKEITIAARLGGGDINANPRLRTAVAAAKAQSMPNDNIDRAIKKGTGELGGGHLEQVAYEGYGPGGVALIVDVLTDNRNRTVSEIRFLLSKHGGNLGEAGCVAWMFKKRGVIAVERNTVDEDRLMELVLEAGADDMVSDAEGFQVICPPESFSAVRDTIEKAGVTVAHAELTMVPENTVKVAGHQAEQVLKLLEDLEDHEDVQGVSANFDMDEQLMAQFSAA
jgi:YebC/PmpR family DNA-binding regulatory protein